ncbi:MAG: hypothetical protein KJO50_02965 [Bacteroidia bacterium]|nr:hypothetical protein [Bacteroidia bacterium]
MKQLQFYKYAALGLLILNLSMITFFFLTKPKKPLHPGPGGPEKAGDILKLDDQQTERFLKFAERHSRQIDIVDMQQRKLMKPYFKSIITGEGTEINDNRIEQALQLERKKIESTYSHFGDIKTLLKSEQQTNFEKFIDHALGKILKEQRKPPPPPKGR